VGTKIRENVATALERTESGRPLAEAAERMADGRLALWQEAGRTGPAEVAVRQ